MKMKEIGPRWGGASLAPPLDPPMLSNGNLSIKWSKIPIITHLILT